MWFFRARSRVFREGWRAGVFRGFSVGLVRLIRFRAKVFGNFCRVFVFELAGVLAFFRGGRGLGWGAAVCRGRVRFGAGFRGLSVTRSVFFFFVVSGVA